jgi:hypothetical protein
MWLHRDVSLRHFGRLSDLDVAESVVEDLIPEPSIRQISLALTFLVGIREGIGFPKDVADEE